MRLSFRAGFVAACLLAPSIAAADDAGWYVGLGVGRANASAIPYDGDFSAAPITTSNNPQFKIAISTTSSASSSTVEGGYWFNSYFGLQTGFLDIGRFSENMHFHDSALSYDSTDDRNVKASGETLDVTGRWLVSDGFELLGRVGLFASHTNLNEVQVSSLFPTNEAHETKDNFASNFGAGLGWKFASHWDAELWWDNYAALGQGDFSKFNVRIYSLVLQYHWKAGDISFAAAMPAKTADSGWYAELDAGQADYSNPQLFVQEVGGGGSSSDWSTKYGDRQQATRALVTYKFDRYFGVEGGYVKFNQASGETTCVNKIDCDPNYANSGAYQLDASGLQADVIAEYPFSDAWSVFARAGFIQEKINFSEEQNTGLFGEVTESDSSLNKTFGAGVGWKVAEDWQVRLGWDRYLAPSNRDTFEDRDFVMSVTMISIGVQYRFGDGFGE
ncbi:MAG TPA: outer membrane beta-barrel protein [Gammaproteobacteria bacterium]|jgi:hypothetical protein